eukprot:scaffold163430_cov48-Prasinocladus_malaysianus.AAC.1
MFVHGDTEFPLPEKVTSRRHYASNMRLCVHSETSSTSDTPTTPYAAIWRSQIPPTPLSTDNRQQMNRSSDADALR